MMEVSLIKGKKGSIQDIAYFITVITALGIMAIFGFMISSKFNDQVQLDPLVPQEGKDSANKLVGLYPGVIDKTFLFLSFGLGIVTLILAALVRVHPIFIALFVIGLTILIFIAAIESNIYQEIASNPQMITYALQMENVNFMVTRLPFVVGVLGFILMGVLYKLNSNTGF